jgi:hypothetical protein
MIRDIDIARLISIGPLPSPMPFHNSTLIKIRLSGTGVAYRRKHDEFVYRDPKLYLSWRFADRWRGVALVENHPESQELDGDTFVSSICGIVTYAFPDFEAGELMGIARIFDKRIAAILEAGNYTTSPAVLNPDGIMLEVGGDKLLAENEPAVIDHVALLDVDKNQLGVWDKGDTTNNPGVEITEQQKDMSHA